jgi:hypothetical protein
LVSAVEIHFPETATSTVMGRPALSQCVSPISMCFFFANHLPAKYKYFRPLISTIARRNFFWKRLMAVGNPVLPAEGGPAHIRGIFSRVPWHQ